MSGAEERDESARALATLERAADALEHVSKTVDAVSAHAPGVATAIASMGLACETSIEEDKARHVARTRGTYARRDQRRADAHMRMRMHAWLAGFAAAPVEVTLRGDDAIVARRAAFAREALARFDEVFPAPVGGK